MKRKSIAAIALAAALAVSVMGNPMLSTVRAEESGEEQVVLQAEEISSEQVLQEADDAESDVQPPAESDTASEVQPPAESDTASEVQLPAESDTENEMQSPEETGTKNEMQPADKTDAINEAQPTDEIVAEADDTKALLSPEEVAEVQSAVPEAETGVAVDENNFPDAMFRAWVAGHCDKNSDGVLSDSEISAVTSINVSYENISDLTGIKFFTNVTYLDCCSNKLVTLDVSGMNQLKNVQYGGNLLTTLDFRNCPNLVVGWHSNGQETVYISAGMTKYIGCDAIRQHTGNIVIDLDGFYTVNPDGSKSVDLDSVVSSVFIGVFAETNRDNPNYDADTHVLTIPAGEGKTEVTAGYDGSRKPTKWTFYTNIQKVDDCVVTFNTAGGSVIEAQTIEKGAAATEPEAPTKDGSIFKGWYLDQEYTQAYDFSAPVNADITLYAKWEDGEAPVSYIVSFDSKGGSAVDAQTVVEGAAAAEPSAPTKAGFLFKGWFGDEAYTQAYDFKAPVNADVTLFAKWEEIRCTLIYDVNGGKWKTDGIQTQVTVNSFGKVTLNIEEPTRTGYKFKGWTLGKGDANKVVKEVTFDQNQQRITVYALWEKIPQKATIVTTVKTGDQTSIGIWAVVVALSAGLTVVLVGKKRKKNGNY